MGSPAPGLTAAPPDAHSNRPGNPGCSRSLEPKASARPSASLALDAIKAYRQADRRLTEKSDTRHKQAPYTLHPTPPIPVSHPHAGLSHPRTSRSLLTHSHILTPIKH
eukprot:scaffold2695_cov142-Isochrysis_galbana.AAC.1